MTEGTEQSTELTVRREDNFSLGRLQPQSVKELAWFAGQVVASGMFKVSNRNMTQAEAFLMMSQGVELGLSPIQSLRELNIINGRVDVPASVRAAKIASSSKVTQWDVASSKTQCTIIAKRKDRTNGITVTVSLADISRADQAKQNWQNYPAEMLYARAVRRISRLYFPDLNLGMSNEEMEEPREIIDVAHVERVVGEEAVAQCENCGAGSYLHPSKNGGAYSECRSCGHRQSPPQAVRDAIRGNDEFLESGVETTETPSPSIEGNGFGEAGENETPTPASHPSEETVAEIIDSGFEPLNEEPEAEGSTVNPSFEEKWRENTRAQLIEFLKAKSTKVTQAENRAALEAVGWTQQAGTVTEWLQSASDEALNQLVKGFHLKPISILEGAST